MSNKLTSPATNTFERIKQVRADGAEFWSARELARVLEYADFRNFVTAITKAREACTNSGHTVSDHFVDITEMVSITLKCLPFSVLRFPTTNYLAASKRSEDG
jgi:DNA-damage-inducible protein D